MQIGTPPMLKPGDKAGRYELLFQVAQGGMGAVWVARLRLDNGFEKLFAVKTLLTHLADQDVFREMFLEEARIAASIEHPNVAQILDMGEQGDLLYLVMEWVEGESLNALARYAAGDNQRVPHGVALRILADACAGLHAVHEHVGRDGRPLDIVHRDVSPHNMLITTRGATKVIDFGVAKARDRLTGATVAGAVKGKLRYMAPEQACGRPVDRRADVWGVGAVLYTLASGRYPYPGESDVDVLRVMVSGAAPAPLPPRTPDPIERVVRRALSLDPAARHATCAELAEDLELAAKELGAVTTQQGVALYVEQNAGARVGTLRAAIRASIEGREADLGSRRISAPRLEDRLPEVEKASPGSHSGTLGLSVLHKSIPLPRRWSLSQGLALLGAVALIFTIGLVVAAATADRPSIPSAKAAAVPIALDPESRAAPATPAPPPLQARDIPPPPPETTAEPPAAVVPPEPAAGPKAGNADAPSNGAPAKIDLDAPTPQRAVASPSPVTPPPAPPAPKPRDPAPRPAAEVPRPQVKPPTPPPRPSVPASETRKKFESAIDTRR